MLGGKLADYVVGIGRPEGALLILLDLRAHPRTAIERRGRSMQLNAKRSRQATQRSLVAFIVGDGRYALDIAQVREIVTPLAADAAAAYARGVWRASPITASRSCRSSICVRASACPARRARAEDQVDSVDVGGRTVGLVVDDVLGVLRLGVAEFGPAPDLGGGRKREEYRA